MPSGQDMNLIYSNGNNNNYNNYLGHKMELSFEASDAEPLQAILESHRIGCITTLSTAASTSLRRKRSTSDVTCSPVDPAALNTITAGNSPCVSNHCTKQPNGDYECFTNWYVKNYLISGYERTPVDKQLCCSPSSPCSLYKNDYYFCYTDETSSNWQYCSLPYSSITVSDIPCRDGHSCGLHGESYYWCYVDTLNNWDYCCAPYSKCDGHCYVSNYASWYHTRKSCGEHISSAHLSALALGESCPEDWSHFCTSSSQCMCYKLFEHPLTWKAALQSCRASDSQLVSIHNREQLEFLHSLTSHFESQDFESPDVIEKRSISHVPVSWRLSLWSIPKSSWLGMHRVTEHEPFSWADGSKVDFLNWSPGEPNFEDQDELCVSFDSHSTGRPRTSLKWKDDDCSKELPYFCQKSPVVPQTKTSEICPPPWTYFCPTDDQCACYMYVNKWLTWQDASDYCNDLHAQLPSIHSQREAKFLDELSNDDPRLPWIGLRLEDNQYRWTDGSLLDFVYWAPGEPNNKDNLELCSQMRTRAYYQRYKPEEVNQTGKWNDFKCTDHEETFFCKRYFVEEIPKCDYSQVVCPPEWTPFCHESMQCSCYQHFTEKVCYLKCWARIVIKMVRQY